MDYVLLSPNDGELLKKAHQMLLEGGVIDDEKWNSRWNPDVMNDIVVDKNRSVFSYALRVYSQSKDMCFMNHSCEGTTPITLTPENLSESVAIVLKAYKQAQS